MDRTIYVSLDLETTGLSPERDRIIEIGMVKFSGRQVIERFSSLINPGRSIPFSVTQLTGIRSEDIQSAPPFAALISDIQRFVGEHVIIGHNIGFDISFLASHGLRLRNRTIDTFALASIVMPHAGYYNLGALASEANITVDTFHRALEDAESTRQLFLSLCDRALELPLNLLQEINRLAAGTGWPLTQLFRSLERQRAWGAFGGTLGEQLRAKGLLGDELGAGGWLQAQDENLDSEKDSGEIAIHPEEMARLLAPDGLIAKHLVGYEYRPQQIQLLQAMAETMVAGGVLMAEAGTGTGKSLAYLIPAAHLAVATGQRVVISTNTINLQDQLYSKDIPDLQRILPFGFRATILKGRSNYLCLRKLRAIQEAGGLSAEEMQIVARILVWAQSTLTGDRGELLLSNESERFLWYRVSADSDSCLYDLCPFADNGTCFLQRARRQAEASHIIIVNHSLLLADAATENAVLPEYRLLIIDEAHHLEDATTEQLSFQIDKNLIEMELGLLTSSSRRPRGPAGLISHIVGHMSSLLSPESRSALDNLHSLIGNTVTKVREEFSELLAQCAMLADEQAEAGGVYGIRLRITEALRHQPRWSGIEIQWDNVSAHLTQLYDQLKDVSALVEEAERLHEDDDTLIELERDLRSRIEFWGKVRSDTAAIISNPRSNSVDWIEVGQYEDHASLHSAPLYVGDLIDQYLISRSHAVIMTSATLSVDGNFSFLKGRLGADEAREISVGSPFDYRTSTLMYFPEDMPEPSEPFYQQTAARVIADVIKALHGRTLVLFTSYSHLRSAYEHVAPELAQAGITVLAQGMTGSRHQLLTRFRDDSAVALFGTRSFWEGIDVVGPALSCVIITRLPFAVPSDPIFAARAESFDDPFNEYSVPDAVLRFRQGFGRLIRSRTDRGAIVMLDRRLHSKRYGQTFLRSLPPCTTERGPWSFAGERVLRWVNGLR